MDTTAQPQITPIQKIRLSRREAADIIGVSTVTVGRSYHRLLAPVRVGGEWRYDPDRVQLVAQLVATAPPHRGRPRVGVRR